MTAEKYRAGLSLFGCALVVSVSGITLAFSLFVKALKDIFFLTQVEVAYLAAATILGHNILLPAGFFYDKLGSKWSMLPGGVCSCSGWLIILVSTLTRQTVSPYHSLQVLLLSSALFMAAHGRTYLYLSSLSTCVVNVPDNLRPFTIGLMETVVGTVPLVFPFVFGSLLSHSEIVPSFIKFLSCLLGLCAFGAILGSLFMTKSSSLEFGEFRMNCCQPSDDTDEQGRLLKPVPSTGTITSEKVPQEGTQIASFKKCETLTELVFSVEYNMIFWTASLIAAVTLFYDYNIVFLLYAVGHREESVFVITMYRVSVTCSRIVLSILLQFLREKYSFPYILPLLCGGLTVTFVVLTMLFAEYLSCIRVAYVLLGFCTGVIFVYPPILIIDIFGLDNFGRNVGIVNSAIPIFMLCINLCSSYFYDQQTASESELYCYGKQCFRVPFFITLIIAIVSTFLAAFFYFRKVASKIDVNP